MQPTSIRALTLRLAILGALFLCLAPILGQDRGLEIVSKELGGPNAKQGKQYMVFIAVDKYSEWLPLKNPVKDAKAIRDILVANYYVDVVEELYNEGATKSAIFKLFERLQNETMPEDSVLHLLRGAWALR